MAALNLISPEDVLFNVVFAHPFRSQNGDKDHPFACLERDIPTVVQTLFDAYQQHDVFPLRTLPARGVWFVHSAALVHYDPVRMRFWCPTVGYANVWNQILLAYILAGHLEK